MAKTLADLAKDIKKIAKSASILSSEIAIEVTLTIIEDLAYETPVDTSQAISNWKVNLNSPDKSTINPHFLGSRGSTYLDSAEKTIKNAKFVLKNKQPGEPIFITNNLSYIRKLNDGSSVQALSGFVERAILKGKNVIGEEKWLKKAMK